MDPPKAQRGAVSRPNAESKKEGKKPDSGPKDHRSLLDLLLLRERLKEEGEKDLLRKIEICQEPVVLKCLTCDTLKVINQSCKRKWCPCCASRLAAVRSAELTFIVERFRWPLFVTLTMKNCADLDSASIRKLRRAFGHLRHRKLWTSRVTAGVAAVEVTNIGNGWHPHLHAVIDCQWLSYKTPPPRPRDSTEIIREKCHSAAVELERIWSKLLGQETSSVKVKRANASTVAKEVLKYTVTNEALVECEGRIGDLLRALDSCRLMTTFGTAHGSKVKDIRAQAKAAAALARAEATPDADTACYCGDTNWMPDAFHTQQEGMRVWKKRKTCIAVKV